MGTEAHPSLSEIFKNWRAEDRDLESRLDEVRDWMREVSQLGIPHFGETATRLRPLREALVRHFQREDAMIAQLARSYPSPSPEINAVRSQSAYDHDLLLSRLDDLTQRLDEPEPPFTSWQLAMDEIELFVVALEQHEEQEAESIKFLMPSEKADSGDSS